MNEESIFEENSDVQFPNPPIENKDRTFLISIKDSPDPFKNRKIVEAIEHLNTKSLSLIFSSVEIP